MLDVAYFSTEDGRRQLSQSFNPNFSKPSLPPKILTSIAKQISEDAATLRRIERSEGYEGMNCKAILQHSKFKLYDYLESLITPLF